MNSWSLLPQDTDTFSFLRWDSKISRTSLKTNTNEMRQNCLIVIPNCCSPPRWYSMMKTDHRNYRSMCNLPKQYHVFQLPKATTGLDSAIFLCSKDFSPSISFIIKARKYKEWKADQKQPFGEAKVVTMLHMRVFICFKIDFHLNRSCHPRMFPCTLEYERMLLLWSTSKPVR